MLCKNYTAGNAVSTKEDTQWRGFPAGRSGTENAYKKMLDKHSRRA